jgi:hypothetical protein
LIKEEYAARPNVDRATFQALPRTYSSPRSTGKEGSPAATWSEIEGRAAKFPHVGKHDISVIERLQIEVKPRFGD